MLDTVNTATALPASLTHAKVLSVRHWTDELFSFRLERPSSLRFRSGEFVMIGLIVEGKPLLRAYSIASPSWDDGLDFYSIKVPDGPLTSRLQHIKAGDHVVLGKKPTGTLVLDALRPGERVFFFSTGTGAAPFASLARDPETYEKFHKVIFTTTCRRVRDLQYSQSLVNGLVDDPLIGTDAEEKLTFYASTTREPFAHTGRITDLILNGALFNDLEVSPFNPETDRAMICGSQAMIADTKSILEAAGFTEGSNAAPGDFVVEKAFAEQ
ncbi:MAG: ferredoxin--NADP reductase [Pseudomonadota bacterium]